MQCGGGGSFDILGACGGASAWAVPARSFNEAFWLAVMEMIYEGKNSTPFAGAGPLSGLINRHGSSLVFLLVLTHLFEPLAYRIQTKDEVGHNKSVRELARLLQCKPIRKKCSIKLKPIIKDFNTKLWQIVSGYCEKLTLFFGGVKSKSICHGNNYILVVMYSIEWICRRIVAARDDRIDPPNVQKHKSEPRFIVSNNSDITNPT